MPHDIQLRVARNATADNWIEQHSDVYPAFCRYAWQAIMAGHKRMGAKAIIEQVRWHETVTKRGKFKCNNNHVTSMAKRFIDENPQCVGFFSFREGK